MKRVLLLAILSGLFAQDKGQKAYEDGKYQEARAYYENVLKNREKDEGAWFGLGASAYQQQDLEIAARSMNTVMNSEDKLLASKAMFNLGNMFRDQQKMEESLAFYRKALELDPTDKDAKVNYEMLKQVIQQQQDQDQNQGSNQDQNSDDNQNKDQNQDSGSKEKQDQSPKENQEKEKNQQSQASKDNKEQVQQQSQEKQEESEQQKTDKQLQAEAILNALKDQEKINQKRQISKAKSKKLEKDW